MNCSTQFQLDHLLSIFLFCIPFCSAPVAEFPPNKILHRSVGILSGSIIITFLVIFHIFQFHFAEHGRWLHSQDLLIELYLRGTASTFSWSREDLWNLRSELCGRPVWAGCLFWARCLLWAPGQPVSEQDAESDWHTYVGGWITKEQTTHVKKRERFIWHSKPAKGSKFRN